LEKYRANTEKTHNEQEVIDDIIKELTKKRDEAIDKKKKALLKMKFQFID